MTTITLEKSDLTLRHIVEMMRDGPIGVMAQGKPIMAVVAWPDVEESDAEPIHPDSELMWLITQAREQLRREGGLSLAEMRHELGLPA